MRCEITELEQEQCHHCKPKPKAETTAPARFTNDCPSCGSKIFPLDIVGLIPSGDWVCPRCYA